MEASEESNSTMMVIKHTFVCSVILTAMFNLHITYSAVMQRPCVAIDTAASLPSITCDVTVAEYAETAERSERVKETVS